MLASIQKTHLLTQLSQKGLRFTTDVLILVDCVNNISTDYTGDKINTRRF